MNCQACVHSATDPRCKGAFAEHGIIKIHWETWSKCNLTCGFCYRTIAPHLSTTDAIKLMETVKYGGCSTLVLAGGDPSLRRDLPSLIDNGLRIGLNIEIQTNAEYLTQANINAILRANQVGLSLDGWSNESHDAIRGGKGNFDKVLKLMDTLAEHNLDVTVRSVICQQNHHSIHLLAPILNNYSNISRWSLMEFTPKERGYTNQKLFEIEMDSYLSACANVQACSLIPVDIYPNNLKTGAYCLMRSDGQVYGVTPIEGSSYSLIGNILSTHIFELATLLPLSVAHHHLRYKNAKS